MKRRGLMLLLCAALLGSTARAAAPGSAEDPLVSRSYLRDTFLPEAKIALAAITDSAVKTRLDASEQSAGDKILTLSPGQSLTLAAGRQFLLFSGSAAVYTARGETVDVTEGAVLRGGALSPYHRCVVCEDALAYLDVKTESVVKVSAGAESGAGSPFSDVLRADWFYADVVSAVERGLVNGMTPAVYAPSGTLTWAQCLKLVSCMHQLRARGQVTLENSPAGMPWYQSYADYARENGIWDGAPEDYDAAIDRRDFVVIFHAAFPRSEYAPINDVPDGAVPDVSEADAGEGGMQIYDFYRAGILTGYTNTPGYAPHAFGPESTITRAEVAAIMNRMFDETARVRFTI